MHSITIATIISMLNNIEVHGYNNLALLFNSIDILKKEKQEAENYEKDFDLPPVESII